jgi:DNA (cytosine-5)-methyltransferase 1
MSLALHRRNAVPTGRRRSLPRPMPGTLHWREYESCFSRSNDRGDLVIKPARNTQPDGRLLAAGLFAGIGGIEHGLALAGHRTSVLCEIEPTAIAVLEARFPGTPIHPDICKPLKLSRDVNLLTAGFPCQDLSQAGRTKGMQGDQSSLVAHVFDLLEKHQTPWVLLENVPFMLHLARGQAMEFVVAEFERLGYQWAYRVIDSRAFGLPQRRERVYLVASRVDDPRKVLFSGNVEPLTEFSNNGTTAFGFYWTEGNRGLGWAVNAIPTLKGGSTIGIPSPPAILLPDGDVVKPDIRDAERLQGFDVDWTLPAETVARKSARWKLVGNAVTVNVAHWLGEQFIELDGDTRIGGKPLPKRAPWPRAAWNVGDGRFAVALSSWPVARPRPSLAEFLQFEPMLLSEKATAGFLSRFKNSRLAKPEGFVHALERHLERMRKIVHGRELAGVS